MRTSFWLSVCAFGLVGCGGSTDSDGAGGSSSGGQATGGVSTGGVSTGGVSTGGVSTGGTGGSTNECTPTAPCTSDRYCDYPDNRCGEGAPGECKPKPQSCDFLYAPVCACDGHVAGNECAAYTSGNDLNDKGNCTPLPDKTFACGSIFCTMVEQYCVHSVSDVGGTADGYMCKPVPADCKVAPSCGCLKAEPCGTNCTGDALGNWTVTCPGG